MPYRFQAQPNIWNRENEYFSLLSLNSLKNKEASEFTSLDSLKFFKEDYIEYFSLLSLNSLKHKEESEFTSLDSLKIQEGKKNGKEVRSTSFVVWQQSIFESPLNIHKMSQVICHHSWVLVGHGRTFLAHCQLVLLRLVILPVIWRGRECLLHSDLIVSMLPESHLCRVLFKGC